MALGDEEAFTQLYHATSRRVYGLALRILRDPTSAEDAALEAYTSVWRHAASFDSRRGRPMTWILTVTRSKAIDLLRARSRRVEHPLGLAPERDLRDPAPGLEAASEHAESCVRVRTALASLPPDQRLAIETAYFAGLSHSEVAAALGTPLGTVKSRIRLGLTSLRRHLAEVE